MSDGGLLHEILLVADSFRGNALEAFGPYAHMVTLAGKSMAAVVALLLFGAGKSLWAPPTQALDNLAPRAASLLSIVAILLLYLEVQNPQSSLTPLRVAIASTLALVIFGAVYAILYQVLTFRCPDAKDVYVRGFAVHPDAQAVLDGNDPASLPAIRRVTGEIRPTDPQNYFCGIERGRPELIWTKRSLDAAKLSLIASYVPFAISIIVLLASSAFALEQAQPTVTEAPSGTVVQIPSDLLFDFNKSVLKPGASANLQKIARLIGERWRTGPVVVAGYTDGIGSDDTNVRLSHDRAANVAQWLAKDGGLATIPFRLDSHGKKDPIAPNTLPDGTDNPEGRRLNRRVVVTIARER